MRYPPAETAEKHARILDEAIRLFRERGFSDVSVSEIMHATGLTHGPFYNHFASKEALVAECVEHGLSGMLDHLEKFPNSANGKATYVKRYLSAAHRDAPGSGCVLAGLASDIRHAPRARGPFTCKFKAAIDKMASCFPWRSKRTARGDAIRMAATLVGAVILARAVDDEALSDEILKEARRGLL